MINEIETNVDSNSAMINEIETNVDNLEIAMNNVQNKFVEYDHHFDLVDIELLKQLPIGSIIAWSGSLLSHSQIPVGWQLCDGSLI